MRRSRRRSPPGGRSGCCRRSLPPKIDRVLRHQRDVPAQRGRIGVGRARTPSNVTVPDDRIVEPQQQVEDRALAGARRADDRDLLAALHPERHAVEHAHVRPRRIGEADRRRRRPRRAPAPAARPDVPARWIAGSIARISNSRSAAPEAAATSPQTSRQLAEAARREHREQHELAQPARRDAAGEHVLGADPQHDHDAREDQKDDDRGQDRARPGRVDGGLDRRARPPRRNRPIASRSLVKACRVRTAPISSDA